MPGDSRPAYEGGAQARQILNDAEDDLREWRPEPTDEDAATVAATARDSRREREPELGLGQGQGQGQGQVGLAAGTYSSKEGSRRDSGYAPRGGQNYDPNQDYEGGSRAYDYGADPSAQGTSSQMMSGGARPVEEREGGQESSLDLEAGRNGPPRAADALDTTANGGQPGETNHTPQMPP